MNLKKNIMHFDPSNIPTNPLSVVFKGMDEPVLEAIAFITHYNLRIEHRQNRNDEIWKECTIRRLLRFVLTKGFRSQEPVRTDRSMLDFYRIKQPNIVQAVEDQVVLPIGERV